MRSVRSAICLLCGAVGVMTIASVVGKGNGSAAVSEEFVIPVTAALQNGEDVPLQVTDISPIDNVPVNFDSLASTLFTHFFRSSPTFVNYRPTRTINVDIENMTWREIIDLMREYSRELHRNVFDNSTPTGALCWSIWEAYRAHAQKMYGEAALTTIYLYESLLAKEQEVYSRKHFVPGLPPDDFIVWESVVQQMEQVDIAKEYPEFPNDYSIIESLQMVGHGPIRERALDDSQPDAIQRIGNQFFAFIDQQRQLDDPEGFDEGAFIEEHGLSWLDSYVPDCDNHILAQFDPDSHVNSGAPLLD